METKMILFNYFYLLFQDELRKIDLENERQRIGEVADEIYEIFDFYTTSPIEKEERLSIYNKILFDICVDYITLSNTSIDVLPKDTLELVDLILDTIQDNLYKESFLLSLQFIYQDYFNCLKKGRPILTSSEDSSSLSSLQVTLNSCYQITEFEAINMGFVEQNKIMTKLLTMEINHQVGPIPKVLYRIRKDI